MPDIPLTHCKTCHNRLDCTEQTYGNLAPMPEPGHFSFCGHCGAIYRFNKELYLIPATPQDLEELMLKNLFAFCALMSQSMQVKARFSAN